MSYDKKPASTRVRVRRLTVGRGRWVRSASSALVRVDVPTRKARKICKPRSSDWLPLVSRVNLPVSCVRRRVDFGFGDGFETRGGIGSFHQVKLQYSSRLDFTRF